jgi:TPR repeat protein/Zn-dependent protease with chaperone function
MKQFLQALICICLSCPVFADTWDLRSIANSSNAFTNLQKQDRTSYGVLNVSDAKLVRDIVDRYSLLSGIYPRIFLKDSMELNAAAGYIDGIPMLFINKSMLDVIAKDEGMAAALLGHEMSHLYFRHGEARKEIQATGQLIGLIAGVVLEVATQKKTGVTNVGANVGMAIGTAYVTSYTRDNEREADKQGIEWAIKSGYDPYGASRLFSVLEQNSGNSAFPFFQSHPNPSERIETSKQLAASYLQTKNSVAAITVPQELVELNRLIDEERDSQSPKTEAGRQGVAAFKAGDYDLARRKFEECGSEDAALCANNLGVIYQRGLGVSADRGRALTYYKLASENGLALGKANYARAIANGDEGVIDVEKMLRLQLEAAKQGSANAMGSIAYFEQFKSVTRHKLEHPPKDVLVNYAKASSMRGVTDGFVALGSYYRTGFGVDKNLELAERYLLKASATNDPRADADLLILYLDEQKDTKKTEQIRDRIVSNKATSSAAILTEHFCGTTIFNRNSKECYEWSSFGAVNGMPALGRAYGLILYLGIGTSKNKAEGLAWMYSAKQRGDQGASALIDKYVSDFSVDELSSIQKRADNLTAMYGKR